MFKKPAKVGNATAFKQKDRKALIKSIEASYPVLAEGSAKLLMPEICTVSKFQTHSGVHGLLYSNSTKHPIWFAIDQDNKILIPTIFTLQHPAAKEMLPVVTTHEPVVTHLTSGSDLMRPGVIDFPAAEKKNTVVCIEAGGKPVAVGRLEDNSDVMNQNRESGKAVILLHAIKDELYSLAGGKAMEFEESIEEGNVPDITTLEIQHEDELGTNCSTEPVAGVDEATAVTQAKPTQAQVDQVLLMAFASAVIAVKALPAGSLPMAASQFYSAYILPRRPAYLCSPENADFMAVKQSQWKTVGKFFKAMDSKDLCKIKEHKSDIKVVTVNASHPDVVELQSKKFKTVAKEAQNLEIKKSESTAAPSTSYAVISAYKPNEALTSLLSPLGPDIGQHYSPEAITARLKEYIEVNGLIPPADKSFIRLDAVLAKALLKKGESETFLKRQDALERVFAAGTKFYAVQQPGKSLPPFKSALSKFLQDCRADQVLNRKGDVKPIKLSVKQRRSKTVTLIHDLENFGLNPDEVAEDFRKLCASSTSVNPIPGAKASEPGREVMVQGDNCARIFAWLIEKGIPKKYVIM